VTVHHTVSRLNEGGTRDDFTATLRGIQSLHMDGRGYCDVGYHFLVTADGTVWEARAASSLGAHTGSQNTDNLGISFVGCFHPTADCNGLGSTTPPTTMIDGAGAFLGRVVRHYGINLALGSTYFGHRDNPGQATACPGDLLHDRLDDLQAIAEGGGAGPAGTGRVQGTVWNLAITADVAEADDLGARLPGAVVTASQDEVQVASATARDGDAYWSLDVPPGRYELTATLDGFAPASRTVDVAAGDDRWASMGISPATAAVPVTVTVVDQLTQAPVPQARVAFGPVPPTGDELLPVDANGVIGASFPPGELAIRVRAEGYADRDESHVVVAGTPLAVTIGLEVRVVEEPVPDEEPGPVDDGDDVERLVIRNRTADDAEGCSCTSTTAAAPFGALLLLLAPRRRRRR
jgi:MYXO-CTERM domain-containing protein